MLRIFISDEIPKSNCVVWDFGLTFMSQIIWLIQPHSTVMFYNIIKWVIGWMLSMNLRQASARRETNVVKLDLFSATS